MHLMPEWYPAIQWSSSDILIEQKSPDFAAKCKNRSANQGGILTSYLHHQGSKKQVGWGDLQQDLALLDLEPIHQDIFTK